MNLQTSLLITSLGFFIFSCNTNCIEGNGRPGSESRDLPVFTKIELGGAYNLVLTQDSATQSLMIHADENLLPYIKTEVRDGALRVYSDDNICDDVKIAIAMNELTNLDVSGAVEVEMTNRFSTQEFQLEASGAVEATLDVEAEKINTSISGAGEIGYRGEAGRHDVRVSGAGELKAFDLVTGIYDIRVSGAAECGIHVLNELHVSASGASSVLYKGNPTVIKEDVSGASSIKKAD